MTRLFPIVLLAFCVYLDGVIRADDESDSASDASTSSSEDSVEKRLYNAAPWFGNRVRKNSAEDMQRKRDKFSPWRGKRGKFSPWRGKRTGDEDKREVVIDEKKRKGNRLLIPTHIDDKRKGNRILLPMLGDDNDEKRKGNRVMLPHRFIHSSGDLDHLHGSYEKRSGHYSKRRRHDAHHFQHPQRNPIARFRRDAGLDYMNWREDDGDYSVAPNQQSFFYGSPWKRSSVGHKKRRFDPWAGKRSDEPVDKRLWWWDDADHKRAFCSWCGRRKRAFSPWAGKRSEGSKFGPWKG